MSRPVALSVDPLRHRDTATAQVRVDADGEPLDLAMTVPAGRVAMADVLPVLQGLSSVLVGRAAARVAAAGTPVSCRAGCGACCRQMVPVAGTEARALAQLVAAMPPARQAAVRARFDAALRALDAAGLLARIEDPAGITAADQGMAYFRLGIPCPFLEDEACSIHADRPLGCREYSVTSPPANCADTQARDIAVVPVGWKVSHALFRVPAGEGWLPLVLALRFAARRRPPPPEPGPALLQQVFAIAQAEP